MEAIAGASREGARLQSVLGLLERLGGEIKATSGKFTQRRWNQFVQEELKVRGAGGARRSSLLPPAAEPQRRRRGSTLPHLPLPPQTHNAQRLSHQAKRASARAVTDAQFT